MTDVYWGIFILCVWLIVGAINFTARKELDKFDYFFPWIAIVLASLSTLVKAVKALPL